MAHKAAIEAVTKLETGELLVKAYSKGRLSEVNDGVSHFKFYAKHLSYSYIADGSYTHPNYMSFDVEEKFYLTSNHCTKISFFSPEISKKDSWIVDKKKTDAEKKRRQKKILAFIDKVMADAGIKPIPRFKLADIKP